MRDDPRDEKAGLPGGTLRRRMTTEEQRAKDHRFGAICAVLSAAGFAGKAVFIKVIYAKGAVDAITLLTLRMLFSLPFFSLMAWRAAAAKPISSITPKDWLNLSWMGFLGYYFSSYLDFWGLEYIPAALERIILFTYPTWVLLLSVAFLKRVITGRDVAALALSTAGIAITFWNDLRISGSPGALWKGAVLVLGASLVYSVYLITSGKVISAVGSGLFIPAVAMTSTLMIVAQFLLTRPASLLVQPGRIYWLCLGLALFSTVLPIILIVEALKRVNPGTVAIASSVGPILTIFMGVIFLGEPATLMQFVGAAFVLAGVGWIAAAPAATAE